MRVARLIFMTTVMLLTSCGQREDDASSIPMEEWNQANDPASLTTNYTMRLALLPFAGHSARQPWTDSYWPSNRGGLASRWQSRMRDGFSYQVNDFMTVLNMREDQVALLSPAEKYDIYRGDMTYSMVRRERAENHPFEAEWAGLCHGWAAAAINLEEPRPVTLVSPQGVKVPFGAADIKALLAFAQQDGALESDTKVLGERCDASARASRRDLSRPECRDTNAGSFHIVLANMIGLRHTPFIIDSIATEEVWNHPVYAYKSTIVKEIPLYAGASAITAKVLHMRTEISYMTNSNPTWQSGILTASASATDTYEYTLELDRDGNIVGGEWLQKARPDFMWIQRSPRWTALTTDIEAIYRASVWR